MQLKVKKTPRFNGQMNNLYSDGYRNIDEDIENFEDNSSDILFKRGFRGNERIATCERGNCKYEVWKINHSSTDNNQGGSSGFRIFYTKEGDEKVILLGIYLKKDIEGDNYKKIAKELVGEYF